MIKKLLTLALVGAIGVIQGLFLLTIGNAATAQSPGGVSADLKLWLRSDQGFTPASWADQSGNGNDYTQTNTNRQPFIATQLYNFNSAVDFGTTGSDARFMVLPAGGPFTADNTDATFFSMTLNRSLSGYADILGFGGTTTGAGLTQANTPALTTLGAQFVLYPYITSPFPSAPLVTDSLYLSDVAFTYNVAGIDFGKNGVLASTNQRVASPYAKFNTGGSILGSQVEVRNGLIPEVIAYQSNLTEAQKQQVRTYLGLKYGITLPHNYIASNGATVVWDQTAHVDYENNIAGVGRDDAGGLYQKQSRSANTGQKLIIGIGGLANSNAANTGTFSDGQYLIWGDNGMAQKPGVAFSGSGLSHRFTSVWQVQNTGSTGTVRIAWPKTNFETIKLIVSSNPTFASGNTVTDMTSNTVTINGTVYNYADVTLSDGDYFTFGVLASSPGGIGSLPAVWYKSENVAGNTWTDASINSIDLLSNVNNSTGPAVNDGDQNHNFNTWTNKYSNVNYFNDVTGTSDVFGVWNDGGGTTSASSDYAGGYYYMPLTVFGVARDTTDNGGSGLITGVDNDLSYGSEPGFAINSGKQRFYRFGNGANVIGDDVPRKTSAVFSWRPPAGSSTATGTSNLLMGLNGAYTNALVNPRSSVAGPYVKIGYSGHVTGVFPGDIQEVVWFKDSLSNADLSKVETYLSLKFGTTLAHDYVNARGDTVFNLTTNAGYVSNIAGIAREDVNGKLYQKQSNSVNVGEKLVIGLTGMANTNDANTGTLNNGQFLIWGNNGEAQSFADYQPTLRPAHGINLLMKSVWKIQNTGSVGTVRVAWPEGDENLTLVQSTDATFDLSDQFTDMIANTIVINGISYNYADVTLTDGQYFTFGSLIKHAPGGVFNGLSVWYRADIDAANTGEGTDVTQWIDYAKGVEANPFSTAPLPKFKAGEAEYFNFNPGVNFTATNQKMGNVEMQLLTSLDFDVFAATKEGMTGTRFFNIGMNNTTLNGTNWDQPGFYTNGVLRRNNLAGGAGIVMGNVSPVPYGSNQPNVMYHHFSDSTYVNGRAGSNLGTKVNHNKIGEVTGGFIFGANSSVVTLGDDAGFVGSIGDLIVYGADSLTPAQRNRVDAYLSIKYGVTMDNASSYVSSEADTVWYKDLDKSFYHNVAGLARDTTSALYQKQSRSQINNNPNKQVTIGLDSIKATNRVNAGTLTEGQFLMWGDNGNTVAMTDAGSTYTEFAYNGSNDNRHMTRIWKVRNTKDVSDSVLIKFPQTSVGTTTVPGETSSAQYVIIYASDSAITQNLVVVPLDVDGTDYVIAHKFPDGVSYFTFGKVADYKPLPVTLIDFQAEKVAETSVLKWTTATESNNRGFSVERSNDGFAWSEIGFVRSKAANGNSDVELTYSLQDNTPVDGTNYYRLKQIDLDNSIRYSEVKVLQFSLNRTITVYPNPLRDDVTVNGLNGNETLKVFDANGKLVAHTKATNTQHLINLSHVSQGNYFIQVSSAEGKLIKTISVVKVK